MRPLFGQRDTLEKLWTAIGDPPKRSRIGIHPKHHRAFRISRSILP
jgi:hypothetical protein